MLKHIEIKISIFSTKLKENLCKRLQNFIFQKLQSFALFFCCFND